MIALANLSLSHEREGGDKMRLRNRLNGYTYKGALRTEHAASSYGQPVLVDVETGDAIDVFSFGAAEILEATPAEIEALRAAGYPVGLLGRE